MLNLIEVYSDGSGNTLASDGGFGYCVVVDGILQAEGNGYLPQATNNVAELSAAIEGLKKASMLIAQNPQWNPDVVLISDSQLVLGYANGQWRCKAEHLKPLHEELRKLYDLMNVRTKWVKGHSSDLYNERCDVLAGEARKLKKATV